MSKLPASLKGKKGSETFLDYAGPFLIPLLKDKDNATNERVEMVLRIPWIVILHSKAPTDLRSKGTTLGAQK